MGLIVDSSVLIAGERHGMSARATIDLLVRELSLAHEGFAVSAVSVAELEHGIHRTRMGERFSARRRFLDDLLGFAPIIPADVGLQRSPAGWTPILWRMVLASGSRMC